MTQLQKEQLMPEQYNNLGDAIGIIMDKEEKQNHCIEDEKNMVTCMRCGLIEEGEERSVGETDETYYLCDNCDGEMNG